MKLFNFLQILGLFIFAVSVYGDGSTSSTKSVTSMPKIGSSSAATTTLSSSASKSTGSTSKSGTTETLGSTSSKSSSSSLPKMISSSSSLPKLSSSSSLSKIATTTSSQSTASPTSTLSITFTPVVPTNVNANPNIRFETLPSGLTFIAVGAGFGLILVSLILARLILFCISAKRAKNAKLTTPNNDYYEYDPSVFSNGKSQSSHSLYSYGSSSTLNMLGPQNSFDAKQQQGRSYRNAISRASRSSLFVSPTEMLSLPALGVSKGISYYDSDVSPIESPSVAYFDQGSSIPKDKKVRRPPSVYMEKLLDDSLSINSDSSSDEFDFTAEKV